MRLRYDPGYLSTSIIASESNGIHILCHSRWMTTQVSAGQTTSAASYNDSTKGLKRTVSLAEPEPLLVIRLSPSTGSCFRSIVVLGLYSINAITSARKDLVLIGVL